MLIFFIGMILGAYISDNEWRNPSFSEEILPAVLISGLVSFVLAAMIIFPDFLRFDSESESQDQVTDTRVKEEKR
ncbi:MAG TPA: hypothetical protein VIK81_02130 [Patescibacteria group bacterium]